MRVLYRWLIEFVQTPLDADFVRELAERLTRAGLEVAAVERVGIPQGIVVGKVLAVSPHPKADRLKLCEVSLGSETVRLVSGAPNLAKDALVPVIRAGGQLPNGHAVEAVVFRGEKSEGMICSRAELGLEEKSPGVWNLEPGLGLQVGQDFIGQLEFDDFVLVLETKSNRPDALSVLGVAREISALYDLDLDKPNTTLQESSDKIEALASVEIEDPEGCPRYACRVFGDLRLGPSSLKMQHRLAKAGLRPISNIVDATNYVLLELGHPTHAFDYDRLEGHKIIVRRARSGERITTLDGVERALSADLVIADARKPVAIAGVMGGAESEVSERTQKVLLESAYFDPLSVRRTSKNLGLRTEASHRFERDMDPEILITALNRVGAVLQQSASSCSVAHGVIDVYPHKIERRSCVLRTTRIEKILGISVPVERTERILQRLEFSVVHEATDRWRVEIPSFRREVEREIDLIEEVGRIYGYDRIPAERPARPLVAGRRDRVEDFRDRIRKILTGLGVSEAVNFGFISHEDVGLFGDKKIVRLRNPMSDESYALRPNLWPGLVRNLQHNAYQQVDGVRLFEIGKVFHREDRTVRERLAVGVAFAGRALVPLKGHEQVYDFYDLKGVAETLLLELGFRNFSFELSAEEVLHPTRQATLKAKDGVLGVLGELHPDIACRYDLPWRAYLLKLNAEEIYQRMQTLALPVWSEIQQKATPKYPASRRDLSLLVSERVPEVHVRRILESERRVERVFLYDLYRGNQIPQGTKSLTYEVTFRDWNKTLSDEEVNEMIGRIEARLKDELGVQIRKG